MLKRKIDTETHAALPKDIKAEYKLVGDEFVLDTDGEDVDVVRTTLKKAKDNEVAAHNATKTRLTEVEGELTEAQTALTAKGTELTAQLEASYKKKVEKAERERDELKAKYEGQLSTLLVDNQASQIASEIAGDNAHLILPFISKRLKADLSGTEPQTLVLGEDGQPSGMSLVDLGKDFLANKKFAAIVTASKATGSGARQQQRGSGTPGAKKLSEMNDQERMAFQKDDPQGFAQAVDEQKKAQRGY